MTHRLDYIMLQGNSSPLLNVTSPSIGGILNTTGSNSNDSAVVDNFDHKWSFTFSVILATILSISAFLTIVGNSMVLMVIIRHRGMRTRTNLFLVNLAVADLFVGLFVVPFSITTLIENRWIFGQGAMCLINGWMNCFCLVTSIHTLMYISIHKYFSIVRPLSNPLKLKYIIAMMAAAWMWAAICSFMTILGLKVEYKPGTSQCGPKYPSDIKSFIIHGILQFTVILIPLVILVFCYVRMFSEIKKHSERLRTNSTMEEDFILSQQKKVAVTLFIVLATFVMMALPYHIYATYTTIEKDKKHFSSYINPIAYTFLYLSSMCNPIIYAFRSPAFREGYKEILCQTPNYVISDESEQVHRTSRLSSIISTLRRPSTFSLSRRSMTNSMLDIEGCELTSPTGTGEKRSKPKPVKQKSLFSLLRSTRQSNAQSVVHRNGDVIIMKGGKIVSVRRGGEGREGTKGLERLEKLKETTALTGGLAAGLACPGHLMLGFTGKDISEKDEEEEEAQRSSYKIDGSSDNSDEVFDEGIRAPEKKCKIEARSVAFGCVSTKPNGITNADSKSSYSVKASPRVKHKPAKVDGFSNVTGNAGRPVPAISSRDMGQTNKLCDSGGKASLSTEKAKLNNVDNSHVSKLKGSKLPAMDNSAGTIGVSGYCKDDSQPCAIVIGGNGSERRKTAVPTVVREGVSRSLIPESNTDPNLKTHQQDSLKAHVITKCMSRSSEDLARRRQHRERLPSMEYLDPPVHLFRSKSNASLRAFTRMNVK